jgi:hypothetical protein
VRLESRARALLDLGLSTRLQDPCFLSQVSCTIVPKCSNFALSMLKFLFVSSKMRRLYRICPFYTSCGPLTTHCPSYPNCKNITSHMFVACHRLNKIYASFPSTYSLWHSCAIVGGGEHCDLYCDFLGFIFKQNMNTKLTRKRMATKKTIGSTIFCGRR